MSLQDIQIYSLVFIIAGGAALIIWERVAPYNKGYKFFRKGLFDDFVMYNLAQTYLLGLFISWFIGRLDASTGWSQIGWISDWPVWAQVTFFVFTHDLYIYLFHRLQHKVKYLWRLHEAHHSPPEVDWIAGVRSHPLEILINQSIEFAPIILLGAAPEVAVIKAAISGVWGMYIHANIDVRMGWLQYIFNGPEMHRWHHADDPKAFETNYGTKFAFWDWIFGTAFFPDPKIEKAQTYGMGPGFEDFPLFGYFRQTVAAFRPFRKQLLHEGEKSRDVAEVMDTPDNVLRMKTSANTTQLNMRNSKQVIAPKRRRESDKSEAKDPK